jgi:hypothetical protein
MFVLAEFIGAGLALASLRFLFPSPLPMLSSAADWV